MDTFLIFVIIIVGGVSAAFINRLSAKIRFIASVVGLFVMFVLSLTIAENKPFYASMLCLIGVAVFFRNYLEFNKISVNKD